MVPFVRSKVTIKDVARACGVSTQTISRVLNKKVDVSSATREKILAVMEEMDYQPSALARSMRLQTKTIGVIIAGLHFFGISTTLTGITQAAEARGYNLMLKELPSFDSMEMQPLIQSLTAHQVQGIICAAPEVSENWKSIQKNLSNQIPPMVFLKGNPSSAPVTISLDNYSGAYAITRHLFDQGYRHIGHISGALEGWEARERKRAWMRALVDTGLPVSENATISGDWTSSSGKSCMEILTKQYPEMDAVFAANDQMALGVLHYAWEKGIRVPAQLGVAGYDDIPESRFFIPPLTTIDQDLNKLGEMAVRKLLSLKNPKIKDAEVAGNTIILPTELKIRRSTQRLIE
jgi:LacI family transcriptional regulator